MEKTGKRLVITAVLALFLASLLTPLAYSAPQYEETLVLITPSRSDLLEAVKAKFEAYAREKLGVNVKMEFIKAGSPECMNRIIAWNGKPEADIFFGGDLTFHRTLKEKGLLEAYEPQSEGYRTLPFEFMGVQIKDRDHMWHPKLWWGHGFVYNKQVISKLGLNVPKSWDELLDPEWRDLIVMCTPSRSSSTTINVMIVLQREGWDKGWAYWRRLAANVGTFVQRSHDVHDLVDKGEYAVGFGYHLAAIVDSTKGYPVSIYLDPRGFIVSGVSMLKGAPHPNIAKAFLDWWYTPDAQEAALSVGGIPVIPNLKIEGPPGSPAAALREALGGKDNIYEYLKTFQGEKLYDSKFAEEHYKEVAKIFDESIVAKHAELKDAWFTILDVKKVVKGNPQAEAKLNEAIAAFDKGDYATAKKLALEAKDMAGGGGGGSTMLYVAGAIVVIEAAAAVYFLARRRPGK